MDTKLDIITDKRFREMPVMEDLSSDDLKDERLYNVAKPFCEVYIHANKIINSLEAQT